MPIPSSIPLSQIDLGHRARTDHSGIEDLAEDIQSSGLIQPIVLVEKTPTFVLEYEAEFKISLDPNRPYLLTAGGRRTTALLSLDTPFVYHAVSSDPDRPGFILRGETPLVDQLTLELKENLNREDMDWRDLVKSVVRAFRLAQRESNERGERLTQSTFGSMLGVKAYDMGVACRIYDHFIANPKDYADCTILYQALAVRMQAESKEIARLAVAKTYSKAPTISATPVPALPKSFVQNPISNDRLDSLLPGHSLLVTQGSEDNIIPLSQMFLHTNGLDFMESQPPGFCDHIITDPDYAIDSKSINSGPNNRPGIMNTGIRQSSVEDSLADLYRFLPLAFRAIADRGFLIFWYAINHHEKLQAAAKRAGFDVQPHPVIWYKTDFRGRSNAAPRLQFPRSTEFAMVCRKPGSILSQVQNSSVFVTDEASTTRRLNHPFAKPFAVWKWLYKAVAIPGQIVFDPFVGCGSAPLAAIDFGLRPLGTEISESLYHSLLINLQDHYRSLLGPGVKFK